MTRAQTLKAWTRCVKKGIKRFGLQHWIIDIRVRRRIVLDGREWHALCELMHIAQADITWATTYYGKPNEGHIDMQDAAYHECAHCKVHEITSRFPEEWQKDPIFGEAEEKLADFMVTLARRGT